MKDLWKIAFGVLCGLLAAGLILLLGRPPAGQSVTLLPPPTQGPLTVHVSGAVRSPGVYTVEAGCRVQEAVDAAGGLLPQADLQGVNLAARVQDGQQIVVPTIPPTSAPTSTLSPAELQALLTPASRAELPTFIPFIRPSKDNPVNINTADQAGLEALPDIGAYRAGQIIAYRTTHGSFLRVEDLLKVPGIPQKTYDIIKDLVTVADPLATPMPTP